MNLMMLHCSPSTFVGAADPGDRPLKRIGHRAQRDAQYLRDLPIAQAFGAQMRETGAGAIIHVASISGSHQQGASGAYSEIKRLAGTGVLSFSDTGAGTGTLFYYRLRAFNGSGVDSPYSNEASATSLGGVTIFVNFQPASATVVPGYMVDGGLVYADRGNGYSYGWTVDNSAQARDRNVNSDQRLDTMVPMQAGAK